MTDRGVDEDEGGDRTADEGYRFDPADFDDGDGPTRSVPGRTPLVVGACVLVGGLLLLAESVAAPTTAGLAIRPVALAALVLAVGFLYGSWSYVRRGRRPLGYAHAASALGWLLVLSGTVLEDTAVLAVGAGVLLFGAAGLAGVAWAVD